MLRKAYIDFQALKRLVTVRQALEALGWSAVWSRGNLSRGPCPIHGSARADSRSFACKGPVGYCHKCKRGGDAVRVWSLIHGCTDYESAVTMCQRLGLDVPTRP